MNVTLSRPRMAWRAVDGVVILDKPCGPSSNQVLQRVRRLFRAEKGGHTGALDPLATGVLPILFGEATKLSGLLLEGDKRYVAEVKVGETTRTGDSEGEVIARSDAGGLERAALEAAMVDFVGESEQLPPMYSALKQAGVPLYTLAREGIDVERRPRRVVIHALRLLDFAPGRFRFEVHCSKGTYVRTLAEDLAAAVGQCAHLGGLRRTAAGSFALDRAVDIETLERVAQDGEAALDALLLAPAALVADRDCVRVDEAQAARMAAGQAVHTDRRTNLDQVPVLNAAGRLLGLAECREDGWLQPRRWLRQR